MWVTGPTGLILRIGPTATTVPDRKTTGGRTGAAIGVDYTLAHGVAPDGHRTRAPHGTGRQGGRPVPTPVHVRGLEQSSC